MTIQHLLNNSVIRFVVPSLTKNKSRIPTKSREKFIKAIEGKSLEINGGFTKYNIAQGGYKKIDGTIMHEDVILIETSGVNPLTERELSCFAKELDQEGLYVLDLGNCKAYLYDGEIKDFNDMYDEIIENGEMIRFHREETSNGDFNTIIGVSFTKLPENVNPTDLGLDLTNTIYLFDANNQMIHKIWNGVLF